jgi:hypothetical protein
VATHHGGGETQDAARLALRLPAFCGLPTREEAEQVREVSVARHQEITGRFTSLTKQRREVLGNPERLARLALTPGSPHVQRRASPQNRSNPQEIVHISNAYENLCGPQLACLDAPLLIKNAAPLGRRETALTS